MVDMISGIKILAEPEPAVSLETNGSAAHRKSLIPHPPTEG
jgi:hypothetical protein